MSTKARKSNAKRITNKGIAPRAGFNYVFDDVEPDTQLENLHLPRCDTPLLAKRQLHERLYDLWERHFIASATREVWE